ncbi:putative O-methyltransferase [Aspergillus similis]
MASASFGIAVNKIFSSPPLLAFVPVAAHFNFFGILHQCDKSVTGEEVLSAYRNTVGQDNKQPVPEDTLHAMAGLGLIDSLAEDTYSANELTQHLVAYPSALHGGIHFTREILLASAFLFPKLQASNFSYPFRECDTPMQFAYQCKFSDAESNAVRRCNQMVDIGGGRGELLLQFRDALPGLCLTDKDLVVEEFNDDIGDIPGITLVRWDFKSEDPQPIRGAVVYHLAHVLHNLPDLEAVRLLRKIRDAMAPYSRILVHEMARSTDMAFLHAAMIVLFGAKERSPAELGELAREAGLRVTFEAFPMYGDGVLELMR